MIPSIEIYPGYVEYGKVTGVTPKTIHFELINKDHGTTFWWSIDRHSSNVTDPHFYAYLWDLNLRVGEEIEAVAPPHRLNESYFVRYDRRFGVRR